MKKLSILLFLFTINFGFSQFREAKIVFNDSTFVEGFGEIRNNKIYFKVELKGVADEWSDDTAKAIIFSGYGFSEKYEYIKIGKNPKPKLLEVVEEGSVTLYRDTKLTPNFMINPVSSRGAGIIADGKSLSDSTIERDYFVKRPSEDYAINILSGFKTKALKYFSDCEILIGRINTGIFSKKTVLEMVIYYNDYCNSGEEEE